MRTVLVDVELILFFLNIVMMGVGFVGFIFGMRELRKFQRQLRHTAAIYFPAHINEAAKDGKVTVVETAVDINDVWDEKEEPRS